MQLSREWRGRLPDGSSVVIVNADDVEAERSNQYTDAVVELLKPKSCKELCEHWPFGDVLTVKEFLLQVDSDLRDWPFTYMSWPSASGLAVFHAIGVGSNKTRQNRAGRLGLTLAAILEHPCDRTFQAFTRSGGELQQEYVLAQAAVCAQIEPRSGSRPQVDPAASIVQHEQSPDIADTEYATSEFWVPASGSWVWWFGDCLLVICEDQSSSLFSDAKNKFMNVTGSESCESICEEQLDTKWKELHHAMVMAGLPDTFYAGLFSWGSHRLVGLGRDVEHRKRAACVGLAVLHGGRAYPWSESKWTFVRDAVFLTSKWFPLAFFLGYHQLESELFWTKH